MSARPWRKRRNMTPRRLRKQARLFARTWPRFERTPDGWVRTGKAHSVIEHGQMSDGSWLDFSHLHLSGTVPPTT